MKCDTCRWFHPAHSGTHGYCKLDPPTFTHIDPDTGYARFNNPVVNPESWCAQHEERDD